MNYHSNANISLNNDHELLENIDILKNGSDFEKRKAAS